MTQQEMMLIRRTAWMNIRLEENPALRPPKQRERDDLITAMYMLAYIGAIDMCLYDLVDELTEAGLYRHALKKQINHIMRTVAKQTAKQTRFCKK
jgi:predicted TPR repeat methyltransferase